MLVACYRPIIIKTKADAEKFLKSFSGCAYITGGLNDLCIEKHDGRVIVSSRTPKARGDIFFPYCEVPNAINTIYKYRKYVNAQLTRRDD